MAQDIEALGINVRNIISIFESDPTNSKQTSLRSKSFSRSHTSLKKSYVSEILPSYDFSYQDLVDIEHHLKELEEDINRYESYSKEDHTYFQTELVTVLSEIVNVESNDENISKKKKQLILVVRNLNALLTTKLPGDYLDTRIHTKERVIINKNEKQIQKGQSLFRQTSQEAISCSVSSLKRIFEQKCQENGANDGLNALVKDEREKGSNLRRVMSFGGQTCRYRYLPYKEHISGLQEEEHDERYIVEGTNLKKDRVVHKTNLYRQKSLNELKLRTTQPVLEKQESVKSEEHHELEDFDGVQTLCIGKVSDIIGKIERSISIESNRSSSNNHLANSITSEDDVERKFEEIFIEEVTDIDDDDDDSTLKSEKVIMLCEPQQRSFSSEIYEEELPLVSVSQLVKQLEENNVEGSTKVLHRTISSSLPGYVVDSDDSIETVINLAISGKTNGFAGPSESDHNHSSLEITESGVISYDHSEQGEIDSKNSMLY